MEHITPAFKKISVYQINPRTFSAEGTIKAVTKELTVLCDLGFKVMYLCPIFKEDDSENKENWSKRQLASKTENPKNPYRINDYFEIDSEYGTMDDLREFVKEAHRLGLKVLLDLVYMHIGPNAEILQMHPEFAAKNPDGSVRLTRYNFPRLNFESEGLREYLWCNMVYYVGAIGVDGFRCDVGDAVPLDFWREGVRRIKAINPEVFMLNEGSNSDYLAVFDVNYGWSWHEKIYDLINKKITAKDFIADYNAVTEKCGYGKILRDMDNHDTVTDWPNRIEVQFGSECMDVILALNYTVDGVPMVYCGNELSDKAKLSMFANRFHMGDFEATDRHSVTEDSEKRKLLIMKLNMLKAENEILQNGSTKWLETDSDGVLAFERVFAGKKITYIGNFVNSEAETDFAVTGEILLSAGCRTENGKLILSKYGYVVFEEV